MENSVNPEPVAIEDHVLVLPTKQEAVLKRLNDFRIENQTARERSDFDYWSRKLDKVFFRLCWEKFGVSGEQLSRLDQAELNELAAIVFTRIRTSAVFVTSVLICFPVVGWLILFDTTRSYQYLSDKFCNKLRYYWWYKRIKRQFNKTFEPERWRN